MKIGCLNKFSEIFGGENLKRAIFFLDSVTSFG